MGLYRRILVPTDGSAGTRRAVEHAVDLAAAHGATVHAVYVINTASFASLSVESSWEGVSDMLKQEGEDAVEAVAELGRERGVEVETVLRSGTPSREIVRYAEENGCDLIVMGTHGRGGIDRLLLGSVAERVVRSSNVPVLTVRVGDDAAEETGTGAAETDAESASETDAGAESATDAGADADADSTTETDADASGWFGGAGTV